MAHALLVRKQRSLSLFFSTIYRCISCGSDTKQEINGHIRFMPIATAGIGKKTSYANDRRRWVERKLAYSVTNTLRISLEKGLGVIQNLLRNVSPTEKNLAARVDISPTKNLC